MHYLRSAASLYVTVAIALTACGGSLEISTPQPPSTLTPVAYRLSDTANLAKVDDVRAIAALPNGDIAVAVAHSDSIVVDDQGTTLVGNGQDAGVVVYDRLTGRAKLGFSFGGQAPQVIPQGLAIDASGNFIVVGYASGNGNSAIDFGNGIPVTYSSAEVPFVAKYSASGNLIWAYLLRGSAGVWPTYCSGSNCDRVWDVAVDASGRIAVIGSFSGTLSLPQGQLLFSSGNTDIFALVLNANGVQESAWSIGGPGIEGGRQGTATAPGGLGEMSIAAAPNGQWIIQGTYSNNTEFKGSSSSSFTKSPTNGVRDVFVARYSSSGTLDTSGLGVWTANASADPTDGTFAAPGAMRVDHEGMLYLSLRANLGNQTYHGCSTPTNNGEAVRTLSLTSNLSCRWIQQFTLGKGDIRRTLPDNVGNLFLVGRFTTSQVFPNQTLVAQSTQGDIFLAKLNATTGQTLWGTGIITTNTVAANNTASGLGLDGDGHPWVGGQLFASTQFAQPGQANKVLQPVYTGTLSNNSGDGFVARYDKNDGLLR